MTLAHRSQVAAADGQAYVGLLGTQGVLLCTGVGTVCTTWSLSLPKPVLCCAGTWSVKGTGHGSIRLFLAEQYSVTGAQTPDYITTQCMKFSL